MKMWIDRFGAYLLPFLSAVLFLIFAFAAVNEPLVGQPAATAMVVVALLLVGQQWLVAVMRKRVTREHVLADTLQGRFDAAAASSGGWLYVVDGQSRFVYSNEASRDCLGYEPAELIGTDARALLSTEELQHANGRVGDLPENVNRLIVRAKHKNGEDRWFECTVAPVTDATSNTTIGWSGTARLLTDAQHPGVLSEMHRRQITEILRTEALEIAFQPMIDLTSGRVIGVEALSRFPSRPGVTPDVVFAEAARAGLGLQLELLAVRHALNESRLLDPALHVALNVSPAVLADPALLDAVRASGIDLSRVIIEITEHASVGDYCVLERPRKQLRDLGVRLSIDDAGAGYASLRHIVTLAPDIIKIDRALVADIDTDRARRALVMAVVMFAREMGGTTVIAEGVESPAELAALTTLGVHGAQGYLIGRPTTAPSEWLTWNAVDTLSA